jgi:hypothetical protein
LRKLTGDTPEALPSARQTVIPSHDFVIEYPLIPREVQALLLEEAATVTDLDMEDPLAFDSDVLAVYPSLTIDHGVNRNQPLPPDHPCLAAAPTPPLALQTCAQTPPPRHHRGTTPAARNTTTTIAHLKAQVPHEAKRPTETAFKKHNQSVDPTYNASVKKCHTETCLDLGASIITWDVVITPEARKPVTRGTLVIIKIK